jgi:hypothetical protein
MLSYNTHFPPLASQLKFPHFNYQCFSSNLFCYWSRLVNYADFFFWNIYLYVIVPRRLLIFSCYEWKDSWRCLDFSHDVLFLIFYVLWMVLICCVLLGFYFCWKICFRVLLPRAFSAIWGGFGHLSPLILILNCVFGGVLMIRISSFFSSYLMLRLYDRFDATEF